MLKTQKSVVLSCVNVYVNLMEAVKIVVLGSVRTYIRLGDTTFSMNTFQLLTSVLEVVFSSEV
jgi:hypothetical protein